MNIGSIQLDLTKKTKIYISEIDKSGLDTSCCANTYFAHGGTPGHLILKYFINGKKKLLSEFYMYLKYLLAIRKLSNYTIYNNNKKGKFKNIVVSWSRKNDFLEDGTYNDRYFGTSSKENKNTLWFLISEDGIFTTKLDDNVIVFFKKDMKKLSTLYLTKIFFTKLVKYKFSLRKFFSSLSFYAHISEIVFKKIKPIILENNIDTIITPYESQPFQNYLFKNIKKIKKDIKTMGYIHSTQPFPLLNLYRDGAPEKLFVHGSDQKYHLTNYFGWPEKVVKLIPSLRFKKNSTIEIRNKILLPYYISNNQIYLEQIKNLLSSFNEKIQPLKIVNHPAMSNSKSHLNLIKKLDNLLKLKENVFSKDSKKSETIILGATSLVIEALERGYEFTHICSEPILESYSKTFWPTMVVTQINENTFKYNLKKFGACVNFGVENNMFQKYCIN